MREDDSRHGTNGGYLQHIYDRETSCQPCRDAHADAKRALRTKRYLRRVDKLYIDSTGTIRRIRALMALGWRYCDIDAAAGHHATRATWAHNLTTQAAVHLDTAEKIDAVYDKLCMKQGPSVRLRNLAKKRGWAPPLAWDDIDTDAGPNLGGSDDQIDEVLVARIISGDNAPARGATVAERRAVVAAWPGSLGALDRLTGWRTDRYVERSDGAA